MHTVNTKSLAVFIEILGFEEALIAVPMVLLVVYVGWVLLRAFAAASPGFGGFAILLMVAVVIAGIAGIARALS